MPKVLRIINRFNLGGPTYNAAYLTKYLHPEYETLLIGGENEPHEDSSKFILEELGVEGTTIGDMGRRLDPVSDRRAYKRIRELMRDYKPDIVHTHASKAGALGRTVARELRIPGIVHTFHGHVFHSYFGRFKSHLFRKVERKLAGWSHRIIAISEKQKEELVDVHGICPPEKVEVIPLGFDLDRFTRNTGSKRRAFRERFLLDDEAVAIGIIGRLVPVKDHAFFLKAIKDLVSRSDQPIRVFIIGDGEERESLENMVKELGLDSVDWEKDQRKATVTFTSWLRDIEVVNAGLDIVALTSRNEGTPVSLIEAQAGEKPVVTTRVGGVEDIISDGESGFLVDHGAVEAFADRLGELARDRHKREIMGSKGRRMVKKKFSVDRLITDTKDLYERILKS